MSWLWAAGAYLCGSIPFGLLIARAVSGADVRTVGSGNIGATNVARAAGRPAAIATLALDALKGLVPVLIASRTEQAPPMLASGCAVAAVLGHCFPVWLGFRGGKGVATALAYRSRLRQVRLSPARRPGFSSTGCCTSPASDRWRAWEWHSSSLR